MELYHKMVIIIKCKTKNSSNLQKKKKTQKPNKQEKVQYTSQLQNTEAEAQSEEQNGLLQKGWGTENILKVIGIKGVLMYLVFKRQGTELLEIFCLKIRSEQQKTIFVLLLTASPRKQCFSQ